MKRSVYGVDLNPMAVELAKVSLWLDSFTLGSLLSFLDHYLKCGNSLVGSTIDDLRRAARGWMYGIPLEPLERATRSMELIADLTDATLTEVTRSADTYKQVLAGVRGYRALLDCLTAEHFGVSGASSLATQGSDLDVEHWDATVNSLPARERRWIDESGRISRDRSFFHWDVDFPDVFFASRPAHRTIGGRKSLDPRLRRSHFKSLAHAHGSRRRSRRSIRGQLRYWRRSLRATCTCALVFRGTGRSISSKNSSAR